VDPDSRLDQAANTVGPHGDVSDLVYYRLESLIS
jgi:hypothetical protein